MPRAPPGPTDRREPIRRRERPGPADPGDLATGRDQGRLEFCGDRPVHVAGPVRDGRQFHEDRAIGWRGVGQRLSEPACGDGLAVQGGRGDERDGTDEEGPRRDDDRQIRAAAVQDGAPQADRVDQRVSSEVAQRVGRRRPGLAGGSGCLPRGRLVGRAMVAGPVSGGVPASPWWPPAAGPCRGDGHGVLRR